METWIKHNNSLNERWLMPTQLIKVDVEKVSPQAYYNAHKNELDIIPDGVGLQILFQVDSDYYLIAGPRSGNVLTVNGGAIKHKDKPFLKQLVEEVAEETFGMMQLVRNESGLQLLLEDGNQYPLTILDHLTVLAHERGKYAYVSFTARCNSLTIDQLQHIADTMHPTASFWNKLGNYLFTHFRNAPKDETFSEYWDLQCKSRDELIRELKIERDQLKDLLLVDPIDIFATQSIDGVLDQLHQVPNHKELTTLFKDRVGRFSERSGYYVFKASDLFSATECNMGIKDIKGNLIAPKVLNSGTVNCAFSKLFLKNKKENKVSLFSLQQKTHQESAQPGPLTPFLGHSLL